MQRWRLKFESCKELTTARASREQFCFKEVLTNVARASGTAVRGRSTAVRRNPSELSSLSIYGLLSEH